MTSWRLMSKNSTTAANSRPGADAHWHTPPSTPVLPAQVPLRVRLQCRSLSLGANGVPTAARYDFSHSLLLQIVGTKRITLLPPSAQHRLHLYPYWHGSRQQSQLDWSAASLAFEQDEVAEEHHTAAHHAHKAHSMLWDYIVNHGLHEEHGDLHTHVGDHKENIQRHADNFPNATVVTLELGVPSPTPSGSNMPPSRALRGAQANCCSSLRCTSSSRSLSTGAPPSDGAVAG